MAEVSVRKACDRCHTQKLSCKRMGDSSCERCARLKTECKYSPSRRFKAHRRPNKKHTQAHTQAHTQTNTQTQTANAMGSAPETSSQARAPKRRRTEGSSRLVAPETAAPAPEIAETMPSSSHADVAQGLSGGVDVKYGLDHIGALMASGHVPDYLAHAHLDPFWDQQITTDNFYPPVAARRPRYRPRQITLCQTQTQAQNQNQNQNDIQPLYTGHNAQVVWMADLAEINADLVALASQLPQNALMDSKHGFPIDDMFQLTRRVADFLDQLSSGSRLEGADDPASSMLILSTYVRLLRLYQRVFNLVGAEATRADPSGTVFRLWRLPNVTVGSFAVESSPVLQMSLTVQVAEEFLCRLRGCTTTLDPSYRGGGGDGDDICGAVDVSFKAVKAMEETLGKNLANLRAEIESLLDG